VLAGLLMGPFAYADDTPRAVRLIKQRCAKCHSGDIVNAGVDFSDLTDELAVWKNRFTYIKARDMLTREKMPPEDESKLPPPLRAFLVTWLDQTLANVDIERIPQDPGFIPPRRLTRHEYAYTVQDLFGIDGDHGDALPADQTMGDGFENDATNLTVEPLWFERAMVAADEVVREVWSDRNALDRLLFVRPTPPIEPENALYATTAEEALALDMGESDFTVVAHVEGMPGVVFQKSAPMSDFGVGVKQLVLRRNTLTYKVLPIHELQGRITDVEDEGEHIVAVSVKDGRASLYFDGRFLASAADMANPNEEGHLFKVGERPEEDEEDSEQEEEREDSRVVNLKFFAQALPNDVLISMTANENRDYVFEPAFHWHPGMTMPEPDTITDSEAAIAVITDFLANAFRRPPTETQIAHYLTLFQQGEEAGLPYDIAMQLPVTVALSSPAFLLRTELAPETSGIYPVSSIDMASRLSYFLWASAPDDVLLDVGRNGKLSDDGELIRQVDRMLADERADRFFERFVLQWLRTEGLGDTIRPDADRFPEVSDSLLNAMRQEGVLVFGDLARNNRSLMRLIDGDSTFLNEELAAHYGLPGIEGPEWREVKLSNAKRGGLLTQAGTLTVSSSPRRTSPVFRGKWVLDVLLGEPPPPPPANVPPLPEEAAIEGASLRDLLEAHRSQAACMGCHTRIDPYGFALEQYDAVGRIREKDQDTSSTLFTGQPIDGAEDLKAHLIEDKMETFVRHLSTKMLAYALGRELEFPDERPMQLILKNLKKQGFGAKALIHEVVLSEPFRFKMDPESAEIVNARRNSP
jgi:hypothetical protein